MDENDGRFPDESDVLTPFPLTPEQQGQDRDSWPWLHGWIVSQAGPDEWEVCVQEPALAVLDDGTIPPPGTPDDQCNFPVCFRESSELRPASAAAADCQCTPSHCSRGNFEDHQGTQQGCMVCADLDPDQPCYAAKTGE
jgi:hypothetical protein